MQSPVVHGKLAKWYAEHYYAVEDDIVPVFEKMDTPFLDKKLKPGMKVFDAMMGRGRHAVRYALRGCKVWGNDINPHMVQYARKTAKYLKAKLKITALDATRLQGVPSGHFDATIAMFSALGTIPKREGRQKAMDEFARVTKPGGIVIVHAHNRWDTFFEPMFWGWIVRSYSTGRAGDITTDYNGLKDMFNHFYSPYEFRKSFERAGLKVIEEHYMDYGAKKFLAGPLRKLRADGFIFVGIKE